MVSICVFIFRCDILKLLELTLLFVYYTVLSRFCLIFIEMTLLLKNDVDDEALDRILKEIGEIIYKCKFCSFITDKKLLLISHYRSTHSSSSNVKSVERISTILAEISHFVCSICFSIFLNRELVKQHMIDVIDFSTFNWFYICSICIYISRIMVVVQ